MTIFKINNQDMYIYNLIKKCMDENRDMVEIPRNYPTDKLMELYIMVLGENADRFQYDPVNIKLLDHWNRRSLVLNKMFGEREFVQSRQRFQHNIAKYCDYRGNVYNVILKIYQKMVMSVVYDENVNTAYAAWGPIVEGHGVCEGISMAFSAILKQYKIPCAVLGGTAKRNNGTWESHAWNLLFIDGNFYHVDVTWAINNYKEYKIITYDYFCVTDRDIEVDHRWKRMWCPSCESDKYSFFKYHNQYLDKWSRADSIIEKGLYTSNCIAIKWSDELNRSDIINELADKVLKKVTSKRNTMQENVQWIQNLPMQTIYFLTGDKQSEKNISNKLMDNKKRIKIIERIEQYQCDAIVNIKMNTVNSSSIYKSIGIDTNKFEIDFSKLSWGKVVAQKADELQYSYIVHTIVPCWKSGNDHEWDYMKGCFHNSIKWADDRKIQSILFFIDSHFFVGYPIRKVIQIAAYICSNALKMTDNIHTIYWLVPDKKIRKECQQILEEISLD